MASVEYQTEQLKSTKKGTAHGVNIYCGGCKVLLIHARNVLHIKEDGSIWSRFPESAVKFRGSRTENGFKTAREVMERGNVHTTCFKEVTLCQHCHLQLGYRETFNDRAYDEDPEHPRVKFFHKRTDGKTSFYQLRGQRLATKYQYVWSGSQSAHTLEQDSQPQRTNVERMKTQGSKTKAEELTMRNERVFSVSTPITDKDRIFASSSANSASDIESIDQFMGRLSLGCRQQQQRGSESKEETVAQDRPARLRAASPASDVRILKPEKGTHEWFIEEIPELFKFLPDQDKFEERSFDLKRYGLAQVDTKYKKFKLDMDQQFGHNTRLYENGRKVFRRELLAMIKSYPEYKKFASTKRRHHEKSLKDLFGCPLPMKVEDVSLYSPDNNAKCYVSCDLKQGNLSMLRLLCRRSIGKCKDWAELSDRVFEGSDKWKEFIDTKCRKYANQRTGPRSIDTDNRILESRKTILSDSKRSRQVVLGQTRPRKLCYLQRVVMCILATQLHQQLEERAPRGSSVGMALLFSTDELLFPVADGKQLQAAQRLIEECLARLTAPGDSPIGLCDIVRVSSFQLFYQPFDEDTQRTIANEQLARAEAAAKPDNDRKKNAELSDESDEEDEAKKNETIDPKARPSNEHGFFVRKSGSDYRFKCVSKNTSWPAVQEWVKTHEQQPAL